MLPRSNAPKESNVMRNRWPMAALLVIAAGLMLQSNPGVPTTNPETPSATYSHGVVQVTIPYWGPRAGGGRLTVDVLDPEDRPLAHVEHMVGVNAGSGWWQEDLRLAHELNREDIVWHRLRYRFTY